MLSKSKKIAKKILDMLKTDIFAWEQTKFLYWMEFFAFEGFFVIVYSLSGAYHQIFKGKHCKNLNEL